MAASSSPNLFSLAGRRAVVTGGNRGIGFAMAAALADAGAQVVLVARDERALDAAAAQIGPAASTVVADLADPRAVEAIAHAADPVDILVNAAGVNPRPPMSEIDDATWDLALDVNLRAPFRLGQRIGPAMAERGWGRILHVASQQAHRAFGNSGAYGVSKAGLLGLSRSQAEAWSPHGVTVNAVIPGFVRTAMTESIFVDHPDRAEALAARTMVRRNGTPDDFRGTTVFLCSDASAFVTGQVIAVDGGFSAT